MTRLLLILILLSVNAEAQSPIHIDFDGLSPGTRLSNQFSGIGMHFIQDDRHNQPFVGNSQEIGGASARNAAYSYNSSIGLLFDRPVVSFSVTVAVDPLGVPGQPLFGSSGLDYPSTANYWGVSVPVTARTWTSTGTLTSPSHEVRLLAFDGYNIHQGFNTGAVVWFTDLDVVLLPEPPALTLAVVGIFTLLLGAPSFRIHCLAYGIET